MFPLCTNAFSAQTKLPDVRCNSLWILLVDTREALWLMVTVSCEALWLWSDHKPINKSTSYCISTTQGVTLVVGMSMIISTRKVVNYICFWSHQGKPWLKLYGLLTCKSLPRNKYRGERLIELPCSWFPLKFPLG